MTIKDSKGFKGVKAVDFDGTLSEEAYPYNPKIVGKPIKVMVKLVKQWLKDGDKVVIFTSRMCTSAHTPRELVKNRAVIRAWCKKYLGRELPITAEKHPSFEYWDNKAHRVQTNTGKILAKAMKRFKKNLTKNLKAQVPSMVTKIVKSDEYHRMLKDNWPGKGAGKR